MFIALMIVSISLAMDCFAASISCGISGTGRRWLLGLKVALYFGGFQAGMAALGFLLGSAFRDLISTVDHLIAFVLLTVIGSKMIIEAARHWKDPDECIAIGNAALLTLAVATSIDALALGIGLSVLGEGLLLSASMIGLVAFLLSLSGVLIGDRLKGRFGRYAEVFGGAVLLILGCKILVEHAFL